MESEAARPTQEDGEIRSYWWIVVVGARCVGYALTGALVSGPASALMVFGLTGNHSFLLKVPALAGALSFAWGAFRAAPRQRHGLETLELGMLFNLVTWTCFALYVGAILIYILDAIFTELLEQSGLFALDAYRPLLLTCGLVALQLLGVHLALDRVARGHAE